MDRSDRTRKRAEALRANLLRRKAQARGRAQAGTDPPEAESRPIAARGEDPEASGCGGPERPA